jgi:hypothetical protein
VFTSDKHIYNKGVVQGKLYLSGRRKFVLLGLTNIHAVDYLLFDILFEALICDLIIMGLCHLLKYVSFKEEFIG